MKTFNKLLFWAYNFACLAFVSAEGNLRGSHGIDKNPKLNVGRVLNIIGPDDRVKAQFIQSKPHHAVGFVLGSRACTGVMVGRDLMLTAQSCLNKTADGTIHNMWFAPAYGDDEVPITPARGLEYFYDRELSPSSTSESMEEMVANYDPLDGAFNYMIVRLDRALGDETGYWDTLLCKP